MAQQEGDTCFNSCGHSSCVGCRPFPVVGRLWFIGRHPAVSEIAEEGFPMAMKWYGVHTYSGYENRVKLNLEERIRSLGMQEFFGDILIPSETVIELKKGERKTSTRKFFPGYILIQMELNNDTWHVVKNIPKVTGFVGGGVQPTPITEEEVQKITSRIAEGVEKPKPKVEFEVGETVRVVEGPFVNFTGVVEDVKPEKGKLKVMVSIFGRVSPVELEFIQVEKIN